MRKIFWSGAFLASIYSHMGDCIHKLSLSALLVLNATQTSLNWLEKSNDLLLCFPSYHYSFFFGGSGGGQQINFNF